MSSRSKRHSHKADVEESQYDSDDESDLIGRQHGEDETFLSERTWRICKVIGWCILMGLGIVILIFTILAWDESKKDTKLIVSNPAQTDGDTSTVDANKKPSPDGSERADNVTETSSSSTPDGSERADNVTETSPAA